MLTQIKMSILFFSEKGAWLAQSLEYDLCSQGSSLKDALDGLVAMCFAHMRREAAKQSPPEHPLESVPRAPDILQSLVEDAWKLTPPPEPLYFTPEEIVNVWPVTMNFQLYLVVE